jgi:hypothetical protein
MGVNTILPTTPTPGGANFEMFSKKSKKLAAMAAWFQTR